MNKVIRILLLVVVNHFLANQLGIDSLTEMFWFLMVSFSGMIYGLVTILDTEDNDE